MYEALGIRDSVIDLLCVQEILYPYFGEFGSDSFTCQLDQGQDFFGPN